MKEIICVLSNPAMPGLVKVEAMGEHKPFELMEELYTEGVPLPYECEYACVVKDEAKVKEVVCKQLAAHQVLASKPKLGEWRKA
jgi:hypothetical protein